MLSEEEMLMCFIEAGVIVRRMTLYVMGMADTIAALNEFFALAERIRPFIRRATGKEGDDLADLAMELIRDENLAAVFIRENVTALIS